MRPLIFRPLERPAPVTAILAFALLTVLASSPPSALAQQAPSGTLVLLVTVAGSGAPLQGAQLVVEGTGLGGITDGNGVLQIEGVPIGSRTVAVRYLGFAPERTTVQLREGQLVELAFALRVRPVRLAEVRVPVRRRVTVLETVGFNRRKANGIGTFITREQIEQRHTTRLSDVLRSVPGINLAPTAFSDARASMTRSNTGGRRCPIQYYVDGVLTVALNIDDVRAGDVEGMEIYRGSSGIPPDFNRGTALCGVILIWTRLGR